jgi:hypothetical protein
MRYIEINFIRKLLKINRIIYYNYLMEKIVLLSEKTGKCLKFYANFF